MQDNFPYIYTNDVDPFNDGSLIISYTLDGNTSDVTGNHDGVPTDITYNPSGIFNESAIFNGITSASNATGVVVDCTNVTVSFWAKPVLKPSWAVSLFTDNENHLSFGAVNTELGIYSENNDVYTHWSSGVDYDPTEKWSMYTFTIVDSIASCYIDGVLIASSAYVNIQSTSEFSIGHVVTGIASTDFYYEGELDQVMLFDRALTPSEIEALYRMMQ